MIYRSTILGRVGATAHEIVRAILLVVLIPAITCVLSVARWVVLALLVESRRL